MEKLRRTFAGELARSMVAFTCSRRKGAGRLAAIKGYTEKLKVPWRKIARLPTFWDPKEKAGLRCISTKACDGTWDDPRPVFATEEFASEMYWHKKREACGQLQLRRFVEAVMPGYRSIVGPRFPISDLVKASNDNADVAFLAAAWYYSSIVPSELLPCGLRAWPPARGLQTACPPALPPVALVGAASGSADPKGSAHSG